jgi:pimeloyl-ACP methyl ester carboxylesterase
MSTSSVTSGKLDVPGAQLYYEVRGAGPLVVLVGAPMDARPFAPLADLLSDSYTVLTTDPRGVNRSSVADPDQDSTPEMRADDLSRLIARQGAAPATAILGSSGGAVTALAFAQAHPDQAHVVVAHEPPLLELLPDRAERHAGNEIVIEKWLAGDHKGSFAVFMENAGFHLPPGAIDAMFAGEPDPQAVADNTYQNTHMLRPTAYFRPDVEALRAGGTRIVIGIGQNSAGQVCDRASRELARQLGIEPVIFNGGHTGFTEDAAAFATRLREVI